MGKGKPYFSLFMSFWTGCGRSKLWRHKLMEGFTHDLEITGSAQHHKLMEGFICAQRPHAASQACVGLHTRRRVKDPAEHHQLMEGLTHDLSRELYA